MGIEAVECFLRNGNSCPFEKLNNQTTAEAKLESGEVVKVKGCSNPNIPKVKIQSINKYLTGGDDDLWVRQDDGSYKKSDKFGVSWCSQLC